jgi:hypothetical protein
MRKTVLTYGLIAGAILSVMMLITLPFHDEIGYDRGAITGYTTMVLAFLLIFFGVRSYRDGVGGGTISFGRAFGVGLLIGVVASLCYVATWEIFSPRFAPNFLENYTAYTLDKARAGGASEAELAKKSAEMKQFAELYENPIISSAYTFVEPMPVALIIALVSAGVLSRRRKTSAGDGLATVAT